MKRIVFIFGLLLPLFAAGQRLDRLPPASEIPREYRAQFRATLKEYNARAERLRAQGFDIVLDELSSVPTLQVIPGTSAQTNWGKDLLLPADLQTRILNECTKRVVVKVTDTGGKLTHPDLQEGQRPGSRYTGEPLLDDGNGHGTHCAGIIAGKDIGLAYGLVKKGLLTFKPVKFLTNAGGGSFTWVAQGYAGERAEDIALRAQGTAVIYSGSFGGGTAIIPVVETELQKSVQAGAYFIFAAGNTGGPVNYPAMSPFGIATASLDRSIVASSFSSKGEQILIAMPGQNINSTYKDGTYTVLSGTSMATPFLSAAAAIALSKWGIALLPTQEALRAYLAKIATDIPPSGKDDATGFGIAYIRSILDTQPGGTPPPPPPPPVDPEKVLATTRIENVTMRYSFAGENTLRNLNVISLELYGAGETAESALKAIRETADRYFANSYIAEIPKTGKGVESGLLGAAYWTVTFLNYTGRPIGLRGVRIVAKGEGATDVPIVLENIFDRAVDDLPASYEGVRPQLRKH